MEEIELKFSLSATEAKRLPGLPLLSGATSRREHLVSTYYDTPEFVLRNAGFSLRVRRAGRRRILTLKTANRASAGLHTRREIEQAFIARRALYDQISDAGFRALIDQNTGRRLKPVFVSDVERTVWDIKIGRAHVELALDKGTLQADKRSTAISELEIELKRGTPASLYDFAETLLEDLPLSPENRSKSERGYRLAGAPATPPRKARPPALEPDARAHDAARQILTECLQHIDANSAGVVHERDPEYLHQVRVGIRRMRAALAVFAPVLPAALLEEIAAELRWLMQEVGPARDWDVFVHETLRGDMFADMEARDELAQSARRKSAAALRRARSALGSPRYASIMVQLGSWLVTREKRTPDSDSPRVRELASGVLDKRHRRLHKRGKHFASLNDEDRHEVRVAAKKLRYAAEFFTPLFDRASVQPYLAALEGLQDVLGTLNDIAVTAGLIESLLGSIEDPVQKALKRRRKQEMRKLDDVWRQYARAKPFWLAE